MSIRILDQRSDGLTIELSAGTVLTLSLDPSGVVRTEDTWPAIDFRSLYWFGRTYHFTNLQAKVVELLYQHWSHGAPDVSQKAIERSIRTTTTVPSIFRKSTAWGTLVVAGATKGTLRLAGEPERKSK